MKRNFSAVFTDLYIIGLFVTDFTESRSQTSLIIGAICQFTNDTCFT